MTARKTEEKKEYTVLLDFYDIQDGMFLYSEGNTYPREGVKPTQKRITLLLSDKNAANRPVIK